MVECHYFSWISRCPDDKRDQRRRLTVSIFGVNTYWDWQILAVITYCLFFFLGGAIQFSRMLWQLFFEEYSMSIYRKQLWTNICRLSATTWIKTLATAAAAVKSASLVKPRWSVEHPAKLFVDAALTCAAAAAAAAAQQTLMMILRVVHRNCRLLMYSGDNSFTVSTISSASWNINSKQ